MSTIEIVLVSLAVLMVVFGLFIFAAMIFAFLGAMAMPDDLHDDVLGDRHERN